MPRQDEEPRSDDKDLSNPRQQGGCNRKIGRETGETAGKDEAGAPDRHPDAFQNEYGSPGNDMIQGVQQSR